jgi:hypothetical protein
MPHSAACRPPGSRQIRALTGTRQPRSFGTVPQQGDPPSGLIQRGPDRPGRRRLDVVQEPPGESKGGAVIAMQGSNQQEGLLVVLGWRKRADHRLEARRQTLVERIVGRQSPQALEFDVLVPHAASLVAADSDASADCDTQATADEGMSEGEAKSLAIEVGRATEHDVEVLAADDDFVVKVRRALPGDSWTLRDEQDWQAFGPRILTAE